MKRGLIVLFVAIFVLVFAIPYVNPQTTSSCNLNVSLINQDPYPVVPGNYVEVVFQVSGVDNTDCKGAKFELLEGYPFSLDKNQSAYREISGSTFVQDYKKAWMIPYKLRVDGDALDGMNKIEAEYAPGKSNELYLSKEFNIKIEDVRVDYEVSIREYDSSSNTLTFEILNIGENDVEALTIDIQEQENLDLRESPRNIVGSLDSNEETTFDYTAVPSEGSIDLKITYTDEIGERRSLNKTVHFNPDYYKQQDQKGDGMSFWFYLSIILVAYMAFRWIRNKRKSKRSQRNK